MTPTDMAPSPVYPAHAEAVTRAVALRPSTVSPDDPAAANPPIVVTATSAKPATVAIRATGERVNFRPSTTSAVRADAHHSRVSATPPVAQWLKGRRPAQVREGRWPRRVRKVRQ